MTKKRRASEIFAEKIYFFPKSRIFSQNVGKSHRNLTWGFLGFFSGPSRVFDFFRVATLIIVCANKAHSQTTVNKFCTREDFRNKDADVLSPCSLFKKQVTF